MKKITAMILALLMTLSLAACGSDGGQSSTPSDSASPAPSDSTSPAPSDSTAPSDSNSGSDAQEFDVTWVSCSTESDFWQYQQIGMENAIIDLQDKYGIKINFSVVGPAAEAETEAYIRAFENAVASKPDAIISATQVPDSTVSVAQEAMNQGIVVNFTNCGLEPLDSTQYSSAYNQFYTTVSADIGDAAGKWMLDKLTEMGYTEGVIAMEFSNVNPSLQPRMDNFQAYIHANSNFEVLDCLYNSNDLQKAQADIENEISAYGDQLVGIYGANNTSGNGIALAVENAGIKDKVVTIGVDSDPTEIQALASGTLDCIFVQDAYGQGYASMENAIETLLQGANPESEQKIAMAPVAVTSDNMNEPEYAAMLDPTLLKK